MIHISREALPIGKVCANSTRARRVPSSLPVYQRPTRTTDRSVNHIIPAQQTTTHNSSSLFFVIKVPMRFFLRAPYFSPTPPPPPRRMLYRMPAIYVLFVVVLTLTYMCGWPAWQVIELRAVVQRVEEGPAARLHPCGFTVRRVRGLRASLRAIAHGGHGGRNGLSGYNGYSGSGGGGGSYPSAITTAGVFPSLPLSDERFWPSFSVNTGVGGGGGGTSGGGGGGGGGVAPPRHGSLVTGLGPGPWEMSSQSAAAATPPLALDEFASVDFFIETPGCHTEADFLRLEACVDIKFSDARARPADGVRALTVALTGSQLATAGGVGAGMAGGMWVKGGQHAAVGLGTGAGGRQWGKR